MPDKSVSFGETLLDWFELHGRHDLPWQKDKTAYRVWLSEIMLQQTQVATVIPYYRRFLERFPSIAALADADIDQVLLLWQGLGYYARARNLHKAARLIRDRHDAVFPDSMESVLELPGIGRSTAAAILTFSHGQSRAILDGNVKRVLARCFQVSGWYGQSKTMKRLWERSEQVTPMQRTGDFNQAMMDLGSMVCLNSKPLCQKCPLNLHCHSFQHQTQHLYPHRKPAKTKPCKKTLMLLHSYKDRVLLHRRPPTGVWGGLWSLPEVGGVDEIDAWQARNLSRQPHHLSVSENFLKHQFTHFSLHISVAKIVVETLPGKISDNDDLAFVPLDKLSEYGLPVPVRKILSRM